MQHAALTPERWRQFTAEQQLMMVANEMYRVGKKLEYEESRRLGYQRMLRLTDLCIQVTERRSLRRELLRWRDFAAALYLGSADPEQHEAVFRALLLLTPAGAQQLRVLRGGIAPSARGASPGP